MTEGAKDTHSQCARGGPCRESRCTGLADSRGLYVVAATIWGTVLRTPEAPTSGQDHVDARSRDSGASGSCDLLGKFDPSRETEGHQSCRGRRHVGGIGAIDQGAAAVPSLHPSNDWWANGSSSALVFVAPVGL